VSAHHQDPGTFVHIIVKIFRTREGIFRPQDRHPEEEREGEPWGKADHALIPSGLPKEKRSVIVLAHLQLVKGELIRLYVIS
jgi:hypothetical protein